MVAVLINLILCCLLSLYGAVFVLPRQSRLVKMRPALESRLTMGIRAMADKTMKTAIAVSILLVVLAACEPQVKPIAKFKVKDSVALISVISGAPAYPGFVRHVHCSLKSGFCRYKVRFGHYGLSDWIMEEELKKYE